MRARTALSFFGLCLALGCSNTPAGNDAASGGNDAGSDAASTPGDDSGTDAASTPGDDAGNDAASTGSDGGCDGVLLTMHNVLSWCSVSVNGGAASTGATQTVCVPADTDINLVATAASAAFELGDWHNTDGDTGSGEPGTVSGAMSTATFMTGASGTACVWVCCPFNPSGTGCDVTDPCL
jgi:hypothetical protein